MADKQHEYKGSLISSIGGLFTIAGLSCMTMGSSEIIYLSFMVIGVVLTFYGVFLMLKSKKN